MRLFHEQGYASTGVSTLLREAGVNAGSLYHYFPGKDALLLEVLRTYRRMLLPVVIEPVERAVPDPVDRVFALLAWYRDGMSATGGRMGCPIGNLALEVCDNLPEARPLVDANFQGWTDAVKAWLDAAGDRLPGGIDRKQLAQMVLNTMEGGIMQVRARGTLEPFDAAVAQLRAYFDLLLADARRTNRKSKPVKPTRPARVRRARPKKSTPKSPRGKE
jgi:AcrR family transcriptional regulator